MVSEDRLVVVLAQQRLHEGQEVQRCKVIAGGLGTADEAVGAVLAEQDFGAAQLAVVVVAHRRAVGTGVVDIHDVADVDLGQHPVDGKLVVVLAQTAHHIIHVIAGLVFLAQHSDVMVCAIHGRTHQVGSAGVQTDVLLIDMLFVDGRCHQSTVGAGGAER